MKFSPEITDLNGIVTQMYERLVAKRYHEVIFHDLAYRGLGLDFVGVCPLHEPCGTPNLLIHGNTPTWQCFSGCGRGTWISYLQKKEGISFWAALERLTLAAQIDLRHFPFFERWKRETELAEIYEKTLKFTQENLRADSGKTVREYLLSRKISSSHMAAMELGAILNAAELQKFLDSAGFDKDLLYGSPRDGRPGAFSDVASLGTHRVVIPFRDEIGRIYSLFTRITPGSTPKTIEKYRPVSALTDEREVLYNLWACIGSDTVLIVEGAFDSARASIAGLPNVIATNGVNVLPVHLDILRRHNVRKIFLLPDTDKVGQETALSTVDLLAAQGFECAVVDIPREFKDVDSLLGDLGEVGVQILRTAISAATSSMLWRARHLAEEHSKDVSGLLSAGLRYASKIKRSEDCTTFLLALLELTKSPVAAFEDALAKLISERLPEVLKSEYLLAAKNCVQALGEKRLLEVEALINRCKELRQKLP